MTVEQTLMLSKMFLAFMLLFLLAAVIMFFKLDIRKAWQIAYGTNVPVAKGKKYAEKADKKLSTRELLANKQATSSDKVVQDAFEATAVLEQSVVDTVEKTTVLDAENIAITTVNDKTMVLERGKMELLVDITYIHTSVEI